MRVSMIVGVLLVIFIAAYGIRVNARPKKIDYHSTICQKTNSSAVGTLLAYQSDGIAVTLMSGKTLSVVCPLEHITNGDEQVGNVDATFTIWVQGGSGNTCQLWSVGSNVASISSFPSSQGVRSGTAVLPVPTATDADPISLHVTCDFASTSWLGNIEVKMADHPGP
jgi:hypothetical protein